MVSISVITCNRLENYNDRTMIQLLCWIITLLHLVQGSQWPRGRFGLPRPQTDCPAGNYWKEGFVRQDRKPSNDSVTSSVAGHSVKSHLKSEISANTIRRYFCMKSKNTSSRNWPKGQYCVYMYFYLKLLCPEGMATGYIYWEDKPAPNRNKHNGNVPSGVYTANTRINYCCRTDGDKTQAIQLPTQPPFFLLAYNSSQCQTVRWMEALVEYIQFRREDFMPVNFTEGAHPFLNLTTYSLHYCYYKDCQSRENQTSGTIEAGNQESTSQSQYCSWLITSEANSTVLLNFSSFEFNGKPALNFVNVYDGKDDSGRLLGKFSASSSPLQEEMRTTSSWMFLVLRCFMEENEHCRFKANYVTVHHPTVRPTSLPDEHSYTSISTSSTLPNQPSTKSEGLSTNSKGLSTNSEGLLTNSKGLSTNSEGMSTRFRKPSALPSEQTRNHAGSYTRSHSKVTAVALGTVLPLGFIVIVIIGYIAYKKHSSKISPDHEGSNFDGSINLLLMENESDEELLVVNSHAILRLNTESDSSSVCRDQKEEMQTHDVNPLTQETDGGKHFNDRDYDEGTKTDKAPRYTEDFGSVAAGGASEDGVSLLQQPAGEMSRGAASTDTGEESQEKKVLNSLSYSLYI